MIIFRARLLWPCLLGKMCVVRILTVFCLCLRLGIGAGGAAVLFRIVGFRLTFGARELIRFWWGCSGMLNIMMCTRHRRLLCIDTFTTGMTNSPTFLHILPILILYTKNILAISIISLIVVIMIFIQYLTLNKIPLLRFTHHFTFITIFVFIQLVFVYLVFTLVL